ncbi:hypothetical protein TNCV_2201311 [Trichonephila clavipes]|uniref:Mutator-like transposase domain-containing protein n=1 Tax=Trichonephila clavipes TaxID=2585209 RepID=A0A8X6SGH7_TRICX|nr:hypothetical protein TNCV_2201311 [Trichonephila clavipes]
MRLQKRKGTVEGYEWRCRNQSKDNRHDVVRSVRKGTWFSESKLAITIGDGDTKTYMSLLEKKPYGDNIEIEKIECVGHIQKRMGSRLRKLKSSLGKKKNCPMAKQLVGKAALQMLSLTD